MTEKLRQVIVSGEVDPALCKGKEACPIMKLLGRLDLSKPDIARVMEDVTSAGLKIEGGIQEDRRGNLKTVSLWADCSQQNPNVIMTTDPVDKLIASVLNPPVIDCGSLHYTVFDMAGK